MSEQSGGAQEPALHQRLAESHYAAGRYAAGLHHARLAGSERALRTPSLCVQGACLQQLGQPAQAVEVLILAVADSPGQGEVRYRLAEALKAAGRERDAQAQYEVLLQLCPSWRAAYLNYGCVLKTNGNLEAARHWFEAATRVPGHAADAYRNLGVLYQQRRQFDNALRCYDRALELRPDWSEALIGRSMTLLADERFEEGWQDYDRREATIPSNQAPLPLWDSLSPVPRRLLVHGEQGVGTEIMFASCMPQLLEEVETCFLQCEPRLVSLLGRSFPRARVSPAGDPFDLSRVDARVGIGSLPRRYRRRAEDFPQQATYLKVDAERSAYWQSRLAGLGNSLKIGLSWFGGKPSQRNLRSPHLQQWLPLLRQPNVSWINVQYGPNAAESQRLSQLSGAPLHRWQDLNATDGLDDLAALLSNLDLLISVANSTVHLAGAVNTPTWTLLPSSADYRWHGHGDSNLWHPSLRLFRQSTDGDWRQPMQAIQSELQRHVHNTSHTRRLASA